VNYLLPMLFCKNSIGVFLAPADIFFHSIDACTNNGSVQPLAHIRWIYYNPGCNSIFSRVTDQPRILYWRFILSRVINPDGVGKERTRLVKSIVLTMRELMRQSEPNESTKDMAAFIAVALIEISKTIETSVGAWEKKGYWVKADRFRMEWVWTERLGNQMREAVLNDDWGTIAMIMAQVGGKFNTVEIAPKHRLGEPWQGAWQRLQKQG
jgi:hypothetical protein